MNGPEEQCTLLTVAWRNEDTSELSNYDTDSVARTLPNYIDNRTPMVYSHDLWNIIATELYHLVHSI